MEQGVCMAGGRGGKVAHSAATSPLPSTPDIRGKPLKLSCVCEGPYFPKMGSSRVAEKKLRTQQHARNFGPNMFWV